MEIFKMIKKYELTAETIEINGRILHRIRALRDFSDVKAGDIGGYIEKESNLSHDGDCWIYDDARVYGNARVFDNAQVYGNAQVFDDAWVCYNQSIKKDMIVNSELLSINRSDKYTFTISAAKDNKIAISAGCRYFESFDDARNFWTKTRGGTKLGNETMLILDTLEKYAKLEGMI
jgi:hypothetical protein